ncbi:MAG: MFS transporter [Oligoflexia bacterium]|nr:MFS transporter [Oligoflexia bacterium]
MGSKKTVTMAVVVAALGYFVDIYDLLLFSIVRVASLKSIGVSEEHLLEKGVLLINCQMAGLLLGGILWGILGDKKGRLSVLFGSIFLYSAANIANAFVNSVEAYAVWRFIAGLGLAGELGAGITLVCELMDKKSRGFGTTIIASVGVLGAVVAALVGDFFSWRIAYIVGGVMGLTLLALRVGVAESGMFTRIASAKIKKGDFLSLFLNYKTLLKYLRVVLVGVPIWYTIGILITFSPEFGKSFSMASIPSAGKAVMYSYIGLALGDLSSGLLSQVLKSRKKVFTIYIFMLAFFVWSYFMWAGQSLFMYYFICGCLGFAAGYWAIFVTSASEQFGTNIRSTVTTTAPNFVRGSVIPITTAFEFFRLSFGIQTSAIIVGVATIAISLTALYGMQESFAKELNYTE